MEDGFCDLWLERQDIFHDFWNSGTVPLASQLIPQANLSLTITLNRPPTERVSDGPQSQVGLGLDILILWLAHWFHPYSLFMYLFLYVYIYIYIHIYVYTTISPFRPAWSNATERLDGQHPKR